MCTRDNDIVFINVNYDDDMLLYEPELCCWIMSMLLWDDS